MPLSGLLHYTVHREEYRRPRAAKKDGNTVILLGTNNTSKHPITVQVLADCPVPLSNNVE